ncbi:MAG: hypothetical protein KKG75_01605 [Nanoarchaeota archaeon]|nr:hypothetical protein [Nanoarchaeota archaeon]
MDVTRKIPEEDVKLLNELQEGLRKRDIKLSQKSLIDKAIKFSLKENREDFIKMIKMKDLKKKIDERKLWENWLDDDFRIKGDFIKEHDAIL